MAIGQPLIFISHARKNRRFVDALERELSRRGLAIWVDRQQLQGGQEWPAALREAIERCTLLLLVLSPEALASAAVRREYQYGLSLGKPIIPLLHRRVDADADAGGVARTAMDRLLARLRAGVHGCAARA